MIQIDVPLAAGFGATLAASAYHQLKDIARLWWNPYLASALALTAFALIPGTLFFLTGWTDWDTMYMWTKESLPAWLPPTFVIAVGAASLLGFVAVHALARRGNFKLAMALPAIFGLPGVVVPALFYERFLHVGTMASFEAGGEWNIWKSDLAIGLCVVIPLFMIGPMAVVAARWAKESWRLHKAAMSQPSDD